VSQPQYDRLIRRVAARFVCVASLDVGRSTFTEHLKIHRFHGSLRITEMVNAGKRGKKVRELTVLAGHMSDQMEDILLKNAVDAILHSTYDQGKAALEKLLAEGAAFTLHERLLRGIDVEPTGTTLNLEKKFPNGNIVSITSSPHEFIVKDSAALGRDGKPGFRQDTLYSCASKKDGILFYGWLKDNLAAASRMTMMELRETWDTLGVRYNYH